MSSCEASQKKSIREMSVEDLNSNLEALKEEYETIACDKDSQMATEGRSFELRCPITKSALINPVILSVDGRSYEHSSLLRYINYAQQRGEDLVSPINGKKFTYSERDDDLCLVRNIDLSELLRTIFPILRKIDEIQDELKRRHRESSAQESHSAMPLDIDGQDDVPQEVGAQAATTESDAVDIPRIPIAPISSEYFTIFRTNIDETSQINSHCLKFLMLGVSSKSILMDGISNPLRQSDIARMGIDFKNFEVPVDETLYKIQIWDTSRREIFGNILSSCFRGVKGISLVFDCSCERSFEELDSLVTIISRHESMQGVVIPKILIGMNRIDLGREYAVSDSQVQAKAIELRARYFEYSYGPGAMQSSLDIFSSFVEDIHRTRVSQNPSYGRREDREDEYSDVVAPGCLIS